MGALPALAADVPQQAQALIKESGADVQRFSALTPAGLLEWAGRLLETTWVEPLQFGARLLGYLLLSCLVTLAAGRGGWRSCADAVAVLGFGAVSLGAMSGLISAVGDAAAQSQAYLTTFAPVYAGVLALGGQTAGAAVYQGMFLAAAGLLTGGIGGVILPVMRIYFCFAVSAALWGNAGIEAAARLFGRCLNWLLKGCGAVLSLVLGLQSVFAGSTDSAVLKFGQSALSGMIPVVGDAAAAALTGTLSALHLLKGTLALAAVAAVSALFLPVFVRGLLYTLVFYAAGVLAAGSGQTQCGQICTLFAEGARLCGSALILQYFMVVLSTILMVVMGNGG